MSAKKIFTVPPVYVQGHRQSGQYARSLAYSALVWADLCLQGNRVTDYSGIAFVRSHNDEWGPANLQGRREASDRDGDDGLPPVEEMCSEVGLQAAGPGLVRISGLGEVPGRVSGVAPFVAIMWGKTYAAGYRYGSGAKEFFLPDEGLWRAKTTKDIMKVMNAIAQKRGPIDHLLHLAQKAF